MPIEKLDRRMVKKGNATIVQIQIRWGSLPATMATREDYEVIRSCFPKVQFNRAAADIVTTDAVQSTSVGDKKRKRYKAIRCHVRKTDSRNVSCVGLGGQVCVQQVHITCATVSYPTSYERNEIQTLNSPLFSLNFFF